MFLHQKYSPDLNPIEQVFAKFKTLLQKSWKREPTEAISDACPVKSSPSIPPPNAPHTSGTPDTRRPKSSTL